MERLRALRNAFEAVTQPQFFHLDCSALALWVLTAPANESAASVVARLRAHYGIPGGEHEAAMIAALEVARAS